MHAQSVVSFINTGTKVRLPYLELSWDDEPAGNVERISEHGITMDDVEEVLFNPTGRDRSRSSGLPIAFGVTPDGRYILVVHEQIDDCTIFPVTAYEVEV